MRVVQVSSFYVRLPMTYRSQFWNRSIDQDVVVCASPPTVTRLAHVRLVPLPLC